MRKVLAGLLSVVACGFIAMTTSNVASFTPFWGFDEPDCPESLID